MKFHSSHALRSILRVLLVATASLALHGCYSNDSPVMEPATESPPPPATFTLGGSITGLTAEGLVLSNGTDTVTLAPNATRFALPTALASGSTYSITVQTQATGEHCSLSNATGTMSEANVSNVVVTCAPLSHGLGGSISGLASAGLVLSNGSDSLSPPVGAEVFSFALPVAEGGAYAVAVQTQPSGLKCSVGSGSGTMGASDIRNVQVTCSANAYHLSGSISGLTAAGLTLANGTDTVSPAAGASTFSFPQAVAFGGSYNITVQQQPAGVHCSVTGTFPATMGASDVGDLMVSCSPASGFVLLAGHNTCTNPVMADGTGAAASISGINAMVTDRSGNVYMTGDGALTVRKITPAGVVSTLAGSPVVNGTADGSGAQASFALPYGITLDNNGDLYVADEGNVRRVTLAGVVSTVAGPGINSFGYADGQGSVARFQGLKGITADPLGNAYFVDSQNFAIRKMTPTGLVSTYAGQGGRGYADGPLASARFAFMNDVLLDAQGNLYVADTENNAIRKITPAGVVSTLAGGGPKQIGFADGSGSAARFNNPSRLAWAPAGGLYVLDQGSAAYGKAIRLVSAAGVVSTLAKGNLSNDPTGPISSPVQHLDDFGAYALTSDSQGNLYVAVQCAVAILSP